MRKSSKKKKNMEKVIGKLFNYIINQNSIKFLTIKLKISFICIMFINKYK